MRAQATTATEIAEHFASDGRLERVIFPHLPSHPQHDLAKRQMDKGGTVVSLDVKGGQEAAFRFLNALKIITISNNLGDAKSIATHPTTTTHQRLSDEQRTALGITPGLVRVSVGLEDGRDLIDDISNALGANA